MAAQPADAAAAPVGGDELEQLFDEAAAAAADEHGEHDGHEHPHDEDPGMPAVPSRQQMRERVRQALAAGETTVEEVVADMYASQYWTELQITGFLAAFNSSKMGRRLLARADGMFDGG